MEKARPKEWECYRHFKGNEYKILAIAKHTETMEELVVYQDMNGEHHIYARPLSMFQSKVDKDKYPDVSQIYRFERIDEEHDKLTKTQNLLLAFLDCPSATEQIRFLQAKRNDIDGDFLAMAAQCLEFTEVRTDFEERYGDLIHFLRMKERFENGRMR